MWKQLNLHSGISAIKYLQDAKMEEERPPVEKKIKPDMELSANTIEAAFKLIHRRLKFQIMLWAQLKNLGMSSFYM